MISKCRTTDKDDNREHATVVWTRRDEGHMLRRMLDAPVPGKRARGRHNTRWKDSCKRDMESVGLKEDDELDRAKWKNDIHNHSGDSR